MSYLVQVSQLLRDDPRQKTSECIQAVRHCIRALYACSESLRLSVKDVGSGAGDAAAICQAVNFCIELHELVRLSGLQQEVVRDRKACSRRACSLLLFCGTECGAGAQGHAGQTAGGLA